MQLGLEVAFYALQGTDAHIFSGQSTISTRRRLEPAGATPPSSAACAVNCTVTLASLIVVDADGNEWPAYLTPLATWLLRRRVERYFLVRWRARHRRRAALGCCACLTSCRQPCCRTSAPATVIVPHLLASVGSLPVSLSQCARQPGPPLLALVIDRNLKASADRCGSPQFGSHERYLVEHAAPPGFGRGAWVPNREKSRVWYGNDGLFLLWPQCAADAQALLEADQLPGIPKSADTVLDLLLDAGVAGLRQLSTTRG